MLGARRGPYRQKGLSLVELMVGITVGLFVAAAAAMLVANQLSSNRRLLLETQIQQDLRSTADIVTRELRRAGYSLAMDAWVWPDGTEAPNANQGILTPSTSEVRFVYNRAPGETGPYGFKFDAATNTIKSQLADAGWQELTDRRSLKITAFTITDLGTAPTQLPCPKLCADGTKACWPVYRVRDYRVDIAGEAVSDSNVQRSLSTNVRIRNDYVEYKDPLNPNLICPK
ncbi:MAG: prepilin-type N-terminal cleavage/methylation domain-containing protein [Proteobacteria bacterium]|nr:prepilin-type N-terminal cleavage/methylation domain-containing protein [Pseudomonadota bacterium]